MARGDSQVWQVTDPFVHFKKGVPEVYGMGRMVMSDDPIMRTHRTNFVPVTDRIGQQDRFVMAAPVAAPIEAEEATHG